MHSSLTRRRVVTTAASACTLPLFGINHARANAPEFQYKLANDSPMSHPNTIRGQQACNQIKQESNGRFQITQFPNNQLGGDTDMLSQLRSGALEFFLLSGGILSTFVPITSIYGVGYAFKSYDQVWAALDSELGALIRKRVEAAGLHCFETCCDNGFREITSSTHPITSPEDLKGYKIRVPVNPLYVSTFQYLGASPTSINFSEVYSALQTRLVEGQENALVIVESAKLYEVQKYLSTTRHIWDGYLMLANARAWRRLPPDLQEIVTRNFNAQGELQRSDTLAADQSLRTTLEQQGLVFNDPDPEPFRATLIKSGYYGKWRDKYGAEAWSVLERYAGELR